MSLRPQRILLLGGDSKLAERLATVHRTRGDSVIRTTRRQPVANGDLFLDLANVSANRLPAAAFDVAYLCGGVTSLSRCENFPAETTRANVEGTLAVVRHLAARGTFVVFFSTNLVFDGSLPGVPASTRHSPRCEYGRQKAAVEKALLVDRSPVSILRLTKVLDQGHTLFTGWSSALRQGGPIEPFSDMVMAPVDTPCVIRAAVAVATRRQPGIVQLSAAEDISYADAALHLARMLEVDESLVRPRLAHDILGDAMHRPRHTTLTVTPDAEFLPEGAPSPLQAINTFALTTASLP